MYSTSPLNVFESTYQDVYVDPFSETPMTAMRREEFAIRYLYSRSSESQSANVTGQDTIRFRYSDNKIVFAVCDGVGQSFNGHLASQIIGDHLVKWLWDLPTETLLNARAFPIQIREYLNSLTKYATGVVNSYSIPQDMSKVVINVLEEMRSLGSETTFVCGCIALPSGKLPEGGVAISWLGDTVFRMWDKSGHLINMKTDFITGQHWSTQKGLQGKKPYTWVSNSLKNIGRLTVFSDGLMPIKDLIEQVVDDEIIYDSAQAISKSGAGDDLSYLEVSMEHQVDFEEQPNQPILSRIKIFPMGIEVHWLSSTNVSSYKIYCSINGVIDEKTIYEPRYLIRAKNWKTIKFEIQAKTGNLLSNVTNLEFSSNNNNKKKLIVSALILIVVTVIGYLIGQGK
jgi:hypothetical protein